MVEIVLIATAVIFVIGTVIGIIALLVASKRDPDDTPGEEKQ